MDAETVEEIKRHFGIVAVGVRADVQAVAEGLSAHRDEFRSEVGVLRRDFDEVKAMIRLS